jgi:hypothetical protein
MSKYEKPIRQWNAVTYLYDFINIYLPLTPEEERVYKMSKNGTIEKETPDKTDWHLNKELRAKGLVLCKGCGEILPQSEFYSHFRYCKKCYYKRRKERCEQ